jgi:hypothetical protein
MDADLAALDADIEARQPRVQELSANPRVEGAGGEGVIAPSDPKGRVEFRVPGGRVPARRYGVDEHAGAAVEGRAALDAEPLSGLEGEIQIDEGEGPAVACPVSKGRSRSTKVKGPL